MSGILSLNSRRNAIAVESRAAERFRTEFAALDDDACQQHGRCRSLSRNFPTRVNETDFAIELFAAAALGGGALGGAFGAVVESVLAVLGRPVVVALPPPTLGRDEVATCCFIASTSLSNS